jgi:hypothetical protein
MDGRRPNPGIVFPMGLIEIRETRYDLMADPPAKSSAARGSIQYEKWY